MTRPFDAKVAFAKPRRAAFWPVEWCWKASCPLRHLHPLHVTAYWVQYEGEEKGRKLTLAEFDREFGTIHQPYKEVRE